MKPRFITIMLALLSLSMFAGCSGTREAYRAAKNVESVQGYERTEALAKVIAEHYYAVVRKLNGLKDSGQLAGGTLRGAQTVVRETEPIMLHLSTASDAYKNLQSAETKAEIEAAITNAALAVARMIEALRQRGISLNLDVEKMQHDLAPFLPEPVFSG